MKLKELIIKELNSIPFLIKDKNGICEFWHSECITLHKNIFQKGYGKLHIRLCCDDKNGIELCIKLNVPAYTEDFETIYEGFVDSIEFLENLLINVGLKK